MSRTANDRIRSITATVMGLAALATLAIAQVLRDLFRPQSVKAVTAAGEETIKYEKLELPLRPEVSIARGTAGRE